MRKGLLIVIIVLVLIAAIIGIAYLLREKPKPKLDAEGAIKILEANRERINAETGTSITNYGFSHGVVYFVNDSFIIPIMSRALNPCAVLHEEKHRFLPYHETLMVTLACAEGYAVIKDSKIKLLLECPEEFCKNVTSYQCEGIPADFALRKEDLVGLCKEKIPFKARILNVKNVIKGWQEEAFPREFEFQCNLSLLTNIASCARDDIPPISLSYITVKEYKGEPLESEEISHAYAVLNCTKPIPESTVTGPICSDLVQVYAFYQNLTEKEGERKEFYCYENVLDSLRYQKWELRGEEAGWHMVVNKTIGIDECSKLAKKLFEKQNVTFFLKELEAIFE